MVINSVDCLRYLKDKQNEYYTCGRKENESREKSLLASKNLKEKVSVVVVVVVVVVPSCSADNTIALYVPDAVLVTLPLFSVKH